MVFVNKMDRENADFGGAWKHPDSVREELCAAPGADRRARQLLRVIDVVHRQAYTGTGRDREAGTGPGDLEGAVEQYRDMADGVRRGSRTTSCSRSTWAASR